MSHTRLGYLMVKKESAIATAVKPSHPIRFKEGDLVKTPDIIANNPIQNNRWGALNSVVGKVTAEGNYKLDLDANECVHWLAGALGTLVSADVSSLTDASVFSHTIDFANTLYSLSVEQGKGSLTDSTNNLQNYEVLRGFGVMVDSFSISGKDGIIGMEVKLQCHGIFDKADLIANVASGATKTLYLSTVEGLVATSDTVNISDLTPQNETDAIASLSVPNKTIVITALGNAYTVANKAKVELVPQTPSYSTVAKIFTFRHANWQFGADLTACASANEENVEDWSIDFSNNLDVRYGSLRETASKIYEKQPKGTVKFTKIFSSVAERDYYLRNLKRACILTLQTDEIVSATDTLNQKYSVVVKLNDLRYTKLEMNTGVDEIYALACEAEMYYDASDGKAIQMLVYNSKAGTEYTA